MFGWQNLIIAVLLVLGSAVPLAAQPVPAKVIVPAKDVKNWTQMDYSAGFRTYTGVVEELEKRRVTLTCHHTNDVKPKARTFEAVNALADGRLLTDADSGWAYLWSDLKKGDTITVEVVHDAAEDKHYVTMLMIERRAGGQVPQSQKPKGDEQRLGICNLLNDIDNGLDVDDTRVAKVFPMRFIPFSVTDPPPPPIPGGLPPVYQAKLDAIRAKKKDDVKAPPPEKK